jgi:superfamily II DNA or RNA helicase
MNQIVQWIGRVLRKYQGKESAIIYVIYVSDTRDNNILAIIEKAIESTGAKEELLHAEIT